MRKCFLCWKQAQYKIWTIFYLQQYLWLKIVINYMLPYETLLYNLLSLNIRDCEKCVYNVLWKSFHLIIKKIKVIFNSFFEFHRFCCFIKIIFLKYMIVLTSNINRTVATATNIYRCRHTHSTGTLG